MFTAKIENLEGDTLLLTGNEPNYQVVSITGLSSPPALINVTNVAMMDGAIFNSSRLETRNLVIMLKINGDAEKNRLMLYRFFRSKEMCTFYYSNDSVDVKIEGYVETVECDLFSDAEMMQISIICPRPYFESLDEILIDIGNIMPAFTFPFAINYDDPIVFSYYNIARETNVYNGSDNETGVIIDISITGSVQSIEIKNIITGDDMILNYAFQAGDLVRVNTNKGSKSIRLLRAGVWRNIFSAMTAGSVFFQLHVGDNLFTYLVDGDTVDESVTIAFRFHYSYRGV